MSNNFTTDQLTKSQSVDPNSINRFYKLSMMLNFLEITSNNPRRTQNQSCNQLGTSGNTIKRYRDDIQMDSPNNRSKYKTKNKKPDSTVTQSQTHSSNETPKNKISTKTNKKNVLKCGDPNNDPLSGEELINQAFSNK